MDESIQKQIEDAIQSGERQHWVWYYPTKFRSMYPDGLCGYCQQRAPQDLNMCRAYHPLEDEGGPRLVPLRAGL